MANRSHALGGVTLLVLALTPSSALREPDGWNQLYENRNVDARMAFAAKVKQNPLDAETLRGLAIVNMMEEANLASLKRWREFYHVSPASWQAAAWWHSVVELTNETGRFDLLEAIARDILPAKNATPELKASARMVLANASLRAGRTAEADSVWKSMGYLRQWQICGPFDNVSKSGFDKVYPPELGADLTKTMPGKDGQSLRWHRLGIVTREGECHIGPALSGHGASVYYATTAVFSPRAQSVLLRFDPSGATKFWLNDRLIFSDPIYRTSDDLVADVFRAEGELRQGWNTILVKLADEETSSSAFRMRFTSPSGDDLPGIQVDPSHVVSQAVPVSSAVSSTVEPAVAGLIRRQPLSIESAAALSIWLGGSGDWTAAVEALRSAIAKFPKSGWLHSRLWRVLEGDEQGDDAKAERNEAHKLNPRLIGPALESIVDEKSGQTSTEIITRLKSLLKINPESASVYWALYSRYSEAKLALESIQSARTAARIDSGSSNLIRLINAYEQNNRNADAKAALAQALRTSPTDSTLLSSQASNLINEDKPNEAIAKYEMLIKLEGPMPQYRKSLAALYQGMQNRKRAAEILQALREQMPQDGSLCAQLGDVLKEMGKPKEAISLYREAIRLDPSDLPIREKLQIVTGEQPAMNIAPASPSEPILAAAKAAKAGGDSAIFFLNEARILVYPDFATVTRYHKILKVFDKSAAERFQQIGFGIPEGSAQATLESARIIKPNGKVEVIDRTGGEDEEDGSSGVTLPSLDAGDVVDVAYRIENYRRGALSRQFWTQWSFGATNAPTKLSRFVIITPPSLKFQTVKHGDVPEPVTKDVKGWRVQEWKQTDITARQPEVMGPGFLDSSSWLDVSSVDSWAEIVRWYRDLAQPRCVPDAVIRAKAAELTRTATTEEEKLRAIVSFVRGIKYQTTPFRLSAYVPTEGKHVLRDGYADCKDKAALLTALLAVVNIKSNMVLLSGRSQGTTAHLPSTRFNHAIAVVQTVKGPLWIDATAENLEFGGLPFEDQGVPALIIEDNMTGLSVTPIAPAEVNRSVENTVATLGEDGSLKGTLEFTGENNMAFMLREVFRSVPSEKREEALQQMTAKFIKNSSYDGGEILQLELPDKPITLRLKYHADNYSTRAGNFLLVKLPWQTIAVDSDLLMGKQGRKHDLEMVGMRCLSVSSVRLRLPPGYRAQDLEPEVKGGTEWGTYKLTYRMDGDDLIAQSEIKLTGVRIPAGGVKGFADLLKAMARDADKQIVLKKQ